MARSRRAIAPATRDNIHQQATEALLGFRLFDGIQLTRSLLCHCPTQDKALALDTVQTDYESMLAFVRDGGVDPRREQVLEDLVRRVLEILDAIHREIRLTSSDEYAGAHAECMAGASSPDALPSVSDENRAADQHKLFCHLWTMGLISRPRAQEVLRHILSQDSLVQRHCVGAITMALWEYMDPEKRWLLARLACEARDESVRVQAVVAYVLLHSRHPQRMRLYTEDLLLPLGEEVHPLLQSIQTALYMQKHCEELRQRMESLVQAIKENATGRDDFMKKIRKIQQTHVDMNPDAFDMGYEQPFFQDPASWWLPYDPSRDDVKDWLKKHPKMQRTIRLMARLCCDLDIYGMMQLIDMGGVDVQFTALDNPEATYHAEDSADQSLPDAPLINPVARALQNMYRFFRHSKWGPQHANPFEASLFLPNIFPKSFPQDVLATLFDALYRNQLHASAMEFSHKLLTECECDVELLQKLADCYVQNDLNDAAIDVYRQAELIDENNPKTLLPLAHCLIAEERQAEAEECFVRLSQQPGTDPRDWLLQLFTCRMELEEWEEALQTCYEMRYLDVDTEEAWIGILTCTLEMKLVAKAVSSAAQMLEQLPDPSPQHLVLAGHAQWAAGHWRQAYDLYREAISTGEPEEVFAPDGFIYESHLLQLNGISPADLFLMRDMLSQPGKA